MYLEKFLHIIQEFALTAQMSNSLISLLIIALIIGGLFYYYTNDIKPAIITFSSVALIPIIVAIVLIILYKYTSIQPNQKHILIIWITLFINILNLGTLIGKYSREVIKKNFDIDYVTRYHFRSTLNLFVVMLLVIGGMSAFMHKEMLIILLSTLGISSIIIAFNHLIARFLLKDE